MTYTKTPNLNADTTADIAAIEQLVADSEHFQNDAERFSQLLTEDVILTNFTRIRLFGRDEVYRVMQNALTTALATIITHNEIEDITFLRPDVAVMSGIKHITTQSADVTTVTAGNKARLTFVLTKNQGEWLIALIQNTPIQTA